MDKQEGKIEAIYDILMYVAHFIREFGNFWELYPTRIRMHNQAYREAVHESDNGVVNK